MKNLIFAFLALLTFQCSKTPSPKSKPTVVTTVAPYVKMIQMIANDTVDAKTLFPPNVDVHSYEPTHQQLDELQNAKIWFYLGEPQEKKLLSVASSRHKVKLVDLAKNAPVYTKNQFKDLHIWLSPELMKTQAQIIYKTLIKEFPENKSLYNSNFENLLIKLDQLQNEIEGKIGNQKPTFLISHSALRYFCQDFGCQQIPLDFHEKLSVQQMHQVIDKISKEHPCILILIPQHSSKAATLIAKKLEIPIEKWNPYAEDYFENMKQLAHYLSHESCHQN